MRRQKRERKEISPVSFILHFELVTKDGNVKEKIYQWKWDGMCLLNHFLIHSTLRKHTNNLNTVCQICSTYNSSQYLYSISFHLSYCLPPQSCNADRPRGNMGRRERSVEGEGSTLSLSFYHFLLFPFFLPICVNYEKEVRQSKKMKILLCHFQSCIHI